MASVGCTRLNNLASTVQTPEKCPGRDAPHSVADKKLSSTVMLRSPEYISSGEGENT